MLLAITRCHITSQHLFSKSLDNLFGFFVINVYQVSMEMFKRYNYTLKPATEKMLRKLAEIGGITKSAWLSKTIREAYDRIEGSYLADTIRVSKSDTSETVSSGED